ncbi:MAG: HAMP domain-containing histidine kinase [Planctomycetes bacterium]|nr:HAMP domain-containing histidine kinase [Planctomycetota bacterium]MBI3834894.1 HAMP domain-containing histidine kinase [Planctomycetota bacterium]
MTAARKSMLAGMAVFLQIALLVIGGVTWATVASFELAKKTVSDAQWAKVHHALYTMESYLKGVVNAETWRPASDYQDFHREKTAAVVRRGLVEVDADFAVVRSPLGENPELNQDWMELYFQLDSNGVASSPQWDKEGSPWSYGDNSDLTQSERRSRLSWEWFQRKAASLGLESRVSEAERELENARDRSRDDSMPAVVKVVQSATAPLENPSASHRPDYNTRKQRWTRGQSRYVPREKCVEATLAALTGQASLSMLEVGPNVETASPDTVRVKPGPIVGPFWIERGYDGKPKLAFVRECEYDADRRYQGFIADWGRLKAELLRLIDDEFPNAELLPAGDRPEANENLELRLTQVPALLQVPDLDRDTPARAWHSIRGTVALTWTVAFVVLAVAGFGVRNLVNLTERRMQFAYAVTHELRTPLTTFRLYSDMLSAGLVSEESRPEYLDTLNRESQRLSSLVESVLEYARVENHKVKLNVTEVDGSSLTRMLGETIQKRCSETGVQGRMQNDIAEGRRVRVDANLLGQIAAVLVNNGCRHARQSANPRLLVGLSADHAKLHADFIDSGPGVDRHDAKNIFKPFRRGRDADTTARGGIGLGLALAREWAGLLGGRLDLVARHHPQYGGAHFRLSVPIEDVVANSNVAISPATS